MTDCSVDPQLNETLSSDVLRGDDGLENVDDVSDVLCSNLKNSICILNVVLNVVHIYVCICIYERIISYIFLIMTIMLCTSHCFVCVCADIYAMFKSYQQLLVFFDILFVKVILIRV